MLGGVVVSFVWYLQGAGIWLVCAGVAVVPVTRLLVRLNASNLTFLRYRFLLAIYGAGLLVGCYEAWLKQSIPVSVADTLQLPETQGEPDLILDPNLNLTRTLRLLYPDRSRTHYSIAVQQMFCLRLRSTGKPLIPVCRDYPDASLDSVGRHLQQAISLGAKTNEDAYYDYVSVLIHTDAPRPQIDHAAEAWRMNFPRSQKPDPTAAVKE